LLILKNFTEVQMKKFMDLLQRFLCVCFSLLILTSCSRSHVVIKDELVDSSSSGVTGTVLDGASLVQGGDLAIQPFKAGSQAEANDELDHLSLMILKGIKDFLDEHKTTLHVIGDNEGQPKIVLEGWVEEFSKTGRLSRMMLHPNQDSLTLKGELWLTSNGACILNFTVHKKFDPKKQEIQDVAYSLGLDIGGFIVKQTKQ